MGRDWIDEGLRHEGEREAQRRLKSQHDHHETSVIREKGPDLMRRLVVEVGAVVDEYRRKAHVSSNELEFEALPREGFCITKTNMPRVALECHPDYAGHVLCCNITRTDDQESKPTEWMINLDLILDESDNVKLGHGTWVFQTVDEAVERMLKPVLFPLLGQPPLI